MSKKITCHDCKVENPEFFMVYDELWEKHVPEKNGNIVLCQECFEKRIGYSLKSKDFTFAPLNHKFKSAIDWAKYYNEEVTTNRYGGTIETNSLNYHVWFYKQRMLIGLDEQDQVIIKINDEQTPESIESAQISIFNNFFLTLLKRIKDIKNEN